MSALEAPQSVIVVYERAMVTKKEVLFVCTVQSAITVWTRVLCEVLCAC